MKGIIIINIVFTTFITITIMVLCDLVLGVTVYRHFFYKFYLPPYYFANDNVIGYDMVNNFPETNASVMDSTYKVWSNELGCFDHSFELDTKDFIILTGDSFIWGYAPFETKCGTIIENIIGMRVLKCGLTGSGTKQQKLKIEKVLSNVKHSPKLIILGYYVGNDLEDDYLFPHYSVVEGYKVNKVMLADKQTGKKIIYTEDELKRKFKEIISDQEPEIKGSYGTTKIKNWLKKNSVIYILLSENELLHRLKNRSLGAPASAQGKYLPLYLMQPHNYPWIESAWQTHLESFRELKLLAKSINSKLLIVLIPSRTQVYDFMKPNNSQDIDWNYTNNRVVNYLKTENIDFIDLLPIFRQYADNRPRKVLDSTNDLYWINDGHWNIKGNRLAALLISEYILKNIDININDKEGKLTDIMDKLKTP